ncbi:urate hydroxylase PuuD [Pelagibius litoralis]|uniref:Urate hydroxylase PuuD n=1 Tax=Pelagibius litoralis TaxID=374515 RepID=A0A967CBY1_9PROT|nr:urate hydroxylase PuuD [Pelagibius litoralis]NIA68683.1 urate hydroxylase PuuD [Pelagibius litoralis]
MVMVFWEWLDMAVRWLHVIAGIAWIGSSFYFIALDLSLRKREGLPEGAGGEAWQVHGGGFYNMVKYMVAPARMPDQLTWFKWEAYTTWLSGVALLVLVYYLQAELYMIDAAVMALAPWTAVAISVGGLALGWVVYDLLCKSPLGRNDTVLALVGFVFLVAISYGFTLVFSGRGVYMQMGALIGTMMVANVFVIIIPNQRKVVADLIAGKQPDPKLGAQAKQRSLHNNYLTLPVIFVMISNHYPLAFASKWNWLILAIVLVMGALIRHFFNTKHKGGKEPWWTWGAAALGLTAIVWLSAQPATPVEEAKVPQGYEMAEVENVVLSRCSMCHAAEPLWEGITVAPKGVLLETPAQIRAHARAIEMQVVRSHAMPPGNITEIEAEERQLLAAWLAAGAPAW